jgi:hypothetical protein
MPVKVGSIHRTVGMLPKNQRGKNPTGNILDLVLLSILFSAVLWIHYTLKTLLAPRVASALMRIARAERRHGERRDEAGQQPALRKEIGLTEKPRPGGLAARPPDRSGRGSLLSTAIRMSRARFRRYFLPPRTGSGHDRIPTGRERFHRTPESTSSTRSFINPLVLLIFVQRFKGY